MKTDNELRRDVEQQLESEPSVDERGIGVSVVDGVVTLSGQVRWDFEREAAEQAVRNLRGVKGVTNRIKVVPESAPTELKEQIERAFRREAEVDARSITVDVQDGRVTLRGHVCSWAERRAAEQAVRDLPGVAEVHNDIVVGEVA